MAFVGRNEKNGAGIQESYVAMETTAKRESWRNTHMHTQIFTVCRDGQIFLLGNIQIDDFFGWGGGECLCKISAESGEEWRIC